MQVLVSKFHFLEFWLLLSRVAPYYSSLPRTVKQSCEKQSRVYYFKKQSCEKQAQEGGQLPSNIFRHLKRTLELLICVKISPIATFQNHWIDTLIPGKKKTNKQINKYTRIRDLSSGKKKRYKLHIFADMSLKLPQQGSLIR